MKKFLWVVLCGLMVSNTFAQRAIISKGSIENRTRIIGSIPKNPEKEEAERFAKKYGIPFREIDDRGRIKEIKRVLNGQYPQFYGTHNINAARTVSTDKVWNGAIEGLNLRGEEILVGVWDGGMIRTSHVEFGSRVYSLDSGFEVVGHSTHVAGTIGAAGLDPNAMGMANACYIEGYDWDNDHLEMRQAAHDGLLISNHSYGFIQGFDFNSSEDRWEWNGDIDIDTQEDFNFGFYGSDARIWDDIAYDNPFYLIVKSAGNDRSEGPEPGSEHYVWDNGWKESTEVRNKDGGPEGFDCIGTQGTSKNILTVGAVNDIDQGYEAPEDVVMTSYSAFGPTDDGRIKPDLVGNGSNLYSAYYNSDTDYRFLSGTSMAAPNVSGSLALLQELYFSKFNSYMRSSTLKGLVLHTADDAGNMGPDYKFGWGLLNTFAAAKFVSNDEKVILEDSIADQTVRNYQFYCTGDSGIRITICWTDPKGPSLPASLDPEDIVLINDLDIRLKKLNDSTVFEPYILDPLTPNSPAQTGDNYRDNTEQIYIPEVEKGYYGLSVSHKGSILNTLQRYSLMINGLYSVSVAEDSTYLDENNGFLQVTDAPEYPLNRRFVWLIEPRSQQPITIYFNEFSTDLNDSVIIYDGTDSNSPILGSFSGTLSNPDTLLSSTSGFMFIEFSSGSQDGFKGFTASYCTTPPQEEIAIIGESYPCFNSRELYHFEKRPETEYRWTLSGILEDSASVQQNSVDLLVPSGSFSLAVTPLNRCGTGDPSIRNLEPLVTLPNPGLVIEGDTVACVSNATPFWVEDDSTATYQWILPGGWKGNSDSSSIRITPEEGSGTIAVIARNSCGESDRIELIVNPTALPTAPIIESERNRPCENSVQDFFILDEEGVEYTWDVESGWEIIGPDSLNVVSVKIGTGSSGRMYLTSANHCGDTPTSRSFQLTPAPVPPVLRLQSSSIENLDEIISAESLFLFQCQLAPE